MNESAPDLGNAFHSTPPPGWALSPTKSQLRKVWDFLGSPLRMVVLPDRVSERFGFTSLRAERMRHVLPELKGRVLDIGCGDNMLLKIYESQNPSNKEFKSVGADIEKWTDDIYLIENSSNLDFPDASFDTISYVACLNHIPERREALVEAARLLRPGGRVVATMIGSFIGKVGHGLWWYSEDKERELHPDELMGLDPKDMKALISGAGLELIQHKRFCYGLNSLYIAEKR